MSEAERLLELCFEYELGTLEGEELRQSRSPAARPEPCRHGSPGRGALDGRVARFDGAGADALTGRQGSVDASDC